MTDETLKGQRIASLMPALAWAVALSLPAPIIIFAKDATHVSVQYILDGILSWKFFFMCVGVAATGAFIEYHCIRNWARFGLPLKHLGNAALVLGIIVVVVWAFAAPPEIRTHDMDRKWKANMASGLPAFRSFLAILAFLLGMIAVWWSERKGEQRLLAAQEKMP